MQKLSFTDGTLASIKKLSLEPDGRGNARAIIDFAPLPTSASSLTTRTEIALTTSAETSKKGVVRILVKVDLPYSGLYPSDTATGASNLKFAPNRSTGKVSAHLVLTLPKECVQDIVQQKAGSVGRECALAHIMAVLAVLDTLKPTENGAVTAYSSESLEPRRLFYSMGKGVNPLVYLDDTNTPPTLLVAEASRDELMTLVDRASRGYQPYGDIDDVGVTTIAQTGV